MLEPTEPIAIENLDDAPLLNLNESEKKDARINEIKLIMEELHNQKESSDKMKAHARSIFIQLALFAYEIEKQILDYEISQNEKQAYKDTIANAFSQYFNIDNTLNKDFREIVEIKVFNNIMKYEDISNMVQELLSRAKENFTEFKFEKPAPTVPPSENFLRTKNNNELKRNCFFSLFRCFGIENKSYKKSTHAQSSKKNLSKSSYVNKRIK